MSVSRIPISQLAKGKWPSILAAIGVPKERLVNRHGPCPFCDAGKDRFRFDDKDGRGTFYCSQCGSGDGVEFVKRWLKVDFKEAAQEIEKHVGTARPIRIRQGREETVVKAEMRSMWGSSKPLGEVPAVAEWWVRRVGFVPDTSELRAVPRLMCPAHGEHPSMLARIKGADGSSASLHRTFLAAGGQKASIPDPRRLMDLPLPKGCAVQLFPYADVLGIAEGLETAVAASVLFEVPVWAALNAVMLEQWTPPPGVRVMVFGDNDDSFTGHAAAYALARRLKREKFDVEVRIPRDRNTDWNDVLMEALADGVRLPLTLAAANDRTAA